MGDKDDFQGVSFWDSLFSTSHVFLAGVAIGAFLTYHYLVKKPADEPSVPAHHDGLKGQEYLNMSAGSWRDSDPDRIAAERTENINRGRRRSSLYH